MTDHPIRLDGWKAIAAHFNRDRSTVARWAEAGDFPVHRVADKRGASVWAHVHELDAWLAKSAAPDAVQPNQTVRAAVRSRRDLWLWSIIAAGLILVLLAVTATIPLPAVGNPPRRTQALPADPALAELYLKARDDWATRTQEGLHRALAELGAVTSRDPTFAPAYAGLADVYILSREFDSMPDVVAFPKAEAAVKAALAIDPNSADGNRSLGFIDYYGHHDIGAAREHFWRSLQVEPDSAQTHFWFGNILIDVGQYEDGLGEMRLARRLNPGSTAIEADYAWALWCWGSRREGLSELEDLASRAPALATVHTYLSFIYLTTGRNRDFLDQREQLAAALDNSGLASRVAAERAAFRRGGWSGVLDLVAMGHPVVGDALSSGTEGPATAAALTGRRDRLLRLLARGAAVSERYSYWRPDEVRFAKWADDREVMDRLAGAGALPGVAAQPTPQSGGHGA
jgi:tetratricopeptide (TPR) repeat protein